jgi:hypothetical protein
VGLHRRPREAADREVRVALFERFQRAERDRLAPFDPGAELLANASTSSTSAPAGFPSAPITTQGGCSTATTRMRLVASTVSSV